MLKRIVVGAAVAACAAAVGQVRLGAQGQAQATGRVAVGASIGNGAGYPTDEQYRDSKEAQALIAKAKAVAGNDPVLQERFEKSCTALGPQRPDVLARNAGKPVEPRRLIEPVKLFDNLYFFGYSTIGAWAITTSQGIILIDTLNSTEDAQQIIEPALKKVGLDPANIKMIIVGHGHFDHFGGAAYLQEKYKARVVMSKIDWDAIEKPNPNANAAQAARPIPKRDVEIVSDGQTVSLGDETISFRITPGHTEGAMAIYIPVKEHAKGINILMLSGANITPNYESLGSFEKALDTAKSDKSQALLNGHPDLFGDELGWMEQVRNNPSGANPFVLTQAQFAKFTDIMKYCAESRVKAMEYKEEAKKN